MQVVSGALWLNHELDIVERKKNCGKDRSIRRELQRQRG